MKKYLPVLFTFLFLISCKEKENDSLISQYRDIIGIWNMQSVSWDSSGIRVSHTWPYNKLLINDDLSYVIFMDLITPVENGTVNIIDQSSSKLELFFAARYPSYSSFAGSHIFGFANVLLVSLKSDEVVFEAVDQGFYPEMEFRFRR
ncbi:MAG: hypothetical protein IPN67_16450 [Bacteroidales bacterium]|nr:hypothetical protein [Bacteroidales bacterium]